MSKKTNIPDINIKQPRGSSSTLTATLTLEIPEGNINEHAIFALFQEHIVDRCGSSARAKIRLQRTITQEHPVPLSWEGTNQ